MKNGFMYILECADGSYYTGSTIHLEIRLEQHQNGEGANHTRKHLPVKLVYFEAFDRIDQAFLREKQVQGWSRKKKEALINGEFDKLPELSRNYTQFPPNNVASTGSATVGTLTETASTGSASKVGESALPVAEPALPVAEPVEATSNKNKL